MRILHTADWHLGKKLDYFSRIQEQADVLKEITEIADQQEVDLVLVAGDLFDTFNPPVEAVELLYHTLKRLTNDGRRPVIAIAGNHDSPDRIDAPDPLAQACGIYFVGYPNSRIRNSNHNEHFTVSNVDEGFLEIQLPAYDYPVRILTTPYANEIRLKQFLGIEDKASALHDALKTNWQRLANQYCDQLGVNLLITHLYMLKRSGEVLEEPDGEKPIKVGNADVVYSDSIPPQIQYTALGHLHRYHQVGATSSPVVYSGSPLSYSFSEAGQEKQVIIVDLEPDRLPEYSPIKLHGGRVLVKKRFEDVQECVDWLINNPNTLVELTLVSDTYLSSQELKSIQHAHDGIIHIIPVVKQCKASTSKQSIADLEKDVKSLFVDYFEAKHRQKPNEELLRLFEEVVSE